MSTNFNNWINVSVASSPSISEYKDVERLVDEKLATALERDLRLSFDPGIDRSAAAAAEGLRVKAEDGGFVIHAKSSNDVLRATSKQMSAGGRSAVAAGGVDDLFSQSSGVPEAQNNPDGTTKLVYKTISTADLFREQKVAYRNFAAKQTIIESFRMNLGNAYNEAMDEVDRKNPGIK